MKTRLGTMCWGALLAATLVACGTSGESDTPATNCTARCEAKLNECGQPNAAMVCGSSVCNRDPTERQLTCAENAECRALVDGTDGCGIGEGGDCPSLSCDCPPETSGVFTIDGRCLRTCDEVCSLVGG